MTWLEWCYYSNGLHKTKIKEWEHTRVLAWMIYKANSDPKKSARVMTTWWKLQTDPGYVPRANKVKGKRLTKKQKTDFFSSMR